MSGAGARASSLGPAPLPRRLGLLTQGTLEGGFLSGWFTEAGCLWAHGPVWRSRRRHCSLRGNEVDTQSLVCGWSSPLGVMSLLGGHWGFILTPWGTAGEGWTRPGLTAPGLLGRTSPAHMFTGLSHPCSTPSPGTRHEDLPCETGRLGRGAGGSRLRWPHSGLGMGVVACGHSPKSPRRCGSFLGPEMPQGWLGEGGRSP